MRHCNNMLWVAGRGGKAGAADEVDPKPEGTPDDWTGDDTYLQGVAFEVVEVTEEGVCMHVLCSTSVHAPTMVNVRAADSDHIICMHYDQQSYIYVY